MYLTYDEYIAMGGTLESTAFTAAARKAEYYINSQSAGRTGQRLSVLVCVPQAVKDCVFALIQLDDEVSKSQIASESQSQGGVSESCSYVTKTEDELSAERQDIINSCFYGGGIGNLLYRGACI